MYQTDGKVPSALFSCSDDSVIAPVRSMLLTVPNRLLSQVFHLSQTQFLNIRFLF